MSLYNPGIPTGSVDLDIDYLNIKNNFSQLNTSFGVDHIRFSVTANNGYHTNVHQVPLAGNPPPVSGISQTYAKTVSGDTQLFSMTGTGVVSQITGYKASSRGWQYLGGLLFQWGVVASLPSGKSKTGAVLFATPSGIDFSSVVYNVQVSPISTSTGTSSSNNSLFIVNSTISKTGFSWGFNVNDSADFVGFYWQAIGV